VRFAGLSALRRGEPGADVVGLGVAEFGVEGEGLLPVVAGLAGVAGGVEGVSEAVVGAGLLEFVADLAGHAERDGVLGAGIFGLADDEEGIAEAVERLGFTGSFAELAEQRQGLLMVADGLLAAAGKGADLTGAPAIPDVWELRRKR
jgi:hypothetical protein